MQALGVLIIFITLLIILPWWVILLLIGGAMIDSAEKPNYKITDYGNKNQDSTQNPLTDIQRQPEQSSNSAIWAATKQRKWENRMAMRRLWAERFGTKGDLFYDDSYDE